MASTTDARDMDNVLDAYHPLLRNSEDCEIFKEEGECDNGASVSSAIFNLTTTIVGAGIMGLPEKMEILGLPIGLLILIAMGFLSESSLEYLLFSSIKANVGSYADLLEETHGKPGRRVMTFCLIVNGIGILVIYLIIIGGCYIRVKAMNESKDETCDVLSGSGEDYPGVLVSWAGGSTWWNSRSFVLSFTTLFVLAPLVAYKRVDSLEVSSAISILLALVFIVITAYLFFVKWMSGSIDFGEIKLVPEFDTWQDVADIFSIIPTMCSAYVCHFNIHPVYAEMSKPREQKMQMAMRWSLVLCTLLYCATSVFGYLLFGESVMTDVLTNFNADLGVPYSQVLSYIVQLSYAIHLMLVFPMIHFSLRLSLDDVLFPRSPPLLEDNRRYVLLTVCLVFTVLIGSLLIPDIETVFDFTGSLATITLAFTLPGLASLRLYPWGTPGSVMPMIFVILGVLVTLTGLSNSLLGLVS